MRRGFTLIEVLVAIVLMTVVAALVLLFFRGVNGVAERGEGRTVDSEGAFALEAIAHHLQQATQGLDEDCGFKLSAAGVGEKAFSFCSLQALPNEPDLRWARTILSELRWLAKPEGGDLIQIQRPVTGPGSLSPMTNRLVSGVTSWEVQVYDGEQWLKQWDGEESKRLPEEIQLKMSLVDAEEALEVRIFIPAGKKIKSTLERQVAPAGL